MRKLSKTFLTISAVLSFIAIGLFFILGIVFIVSGVFGGEAIANSNQGQGGEIGGAALLGSMIGAAVVMFFLAIFSLISGIVSLKARANPTKGNLIVAIIFAAISCTELGILGGIFVLVANARNLD